MPWLASRALPRPAGLSRTGRAEWRCGGCAPNDAKFWLKRLVKDFGQKRIAIIAAGAFADPEVIPFLIDQMKIPKLARVAGESFSLITGAHIAYDRARG